MSLITEKDKMLSGQLYQYLDEELVKDHTRAVALSYKYNATDPSDRGQQGAILKELLGSIGTNCMIENPFYCFYGYNTSIGNDVYFNFGVTIVDCGRVTIGDDSMFGPFTQIYTVEHPIDGTERLKKIEYTKDVAIGKNVWIGGGAIIMSGVSIGDNAVIGAGSIVTKDIPPNTVAIGSPCKIVRKLD